MNWSNYMTISSISDEISEDETYVHKMFPVEPSTRMTIEVHVSFPKKRYFPVMNIYTNRDHVNIKKQCRDIGYGQLGNKDLHPVLTINRNLSGPLKCELDNMDVVQCIGIIAVQDFIPRQFSFSFGFHCDEISPSSSLKGLVYSINLYATNKTNCFDLPEENECFLNIQHGVDLNLFSLETTIGKNN